MPDYFLHCCINPYKSGEIQIFGDFALTVIDLCPQENIACKFAHKAKKNGKLTAQNSHFYKNGHALTFFSIWAKFQRH